MHQAIITHVDFVNVMSYDLMNRCSNVTNHHTSVSGCKQSVEAYINNSMRVARVNLGIPFYAEWSTLKANYNRTGPSGCAVDIFENADGSDHGASGAITLEGFTLATLPPISATISSNGSADPMAADLSNPVR
ncbi:hypothetical protein VP1G_11392 [Cytospora mali]|uniref:GH18 domain-containing protein n=1 Tax=Cytospora mali TaxID=578113 RepID=A0A194VD78_CYTMA|nr:hypothetical protein VP1G_11392 [Valsa mali var. pyri (nom. inval.)]